MSDDLPPPNSRVAEDGMDDDDDDEFMNGILNDMTDPPAFKSIPRPSATHEKNPSGLPFEIDECGDFSQELAAGMARMMKELDLTSPSPPPSKSKKPPSSFQERIQETVTKLEEDPARPCDDDNMDSMMHELMSQMDQLSDTPEFESVLHDMMHSLMSKEILYEPMRELATQYPKYLSDNPTLPADEIRRLSAQLDLMNRVVAIYESDGDQANIVPLMTQIQEFGQPPAELMRSLAPDSEDAANPPDCNVM